MEGVDDIGIVEVDGGSLVRDVDRMVERKIPDGERLVFGIAGVDAALVLVVQLRQARGEFAGARAGRGDHDERSAGLDVLVPAVAVIGHDAFDVVRVSGDRVVQAAGDAELLEAVAVGVGGGLIGVLGEHYGADEEAAGTEHVDESQYVFVIRDAEIAAGLAFFDMVGVDGDDDFHIVHQTFQHAELGVRLKAGQHARGVVVVEELASEFQIEFAAELRDALSDVGGLQLDVFFVVESLAHRGRHPFPNDVVNGKIIPDVVGNKKWDSPMGNPIRHREQLLPFDGRRRLGGAIEDDAVDLAAFVGDARGDRGEHIVGDTGPVGGHGVFRADRAQDDRRAVGALVALDADRVNVSQKHDRALPDVAVETGLGEFLAGDGVGLAQQVEALLGDSRR